MAGSNTLFLAYQIQKPFSTQEYYGAVPLLEFLHVENTTANTTAPIPPSPSLDMRASSIEYAIVSLSPH
jgi:hypothetical protein